MLTRLRYWLASRKRAGAPTAATDTSYFEDVVIASDQGMADFEQTLSDQDQSALDDSQRAADTDESASMSDQRGSDSDKASARRDQRSADKDHERMSPGTAADAVYKDTTSQRNRTMRDREAATSSRQLSVLERASAGIDRDQSADLRDKIADTRDVAAAERDRREAFEDRLTRERLGPEDKHLEHALKLSEELRDRSAIDRTRAAEDRARAAMDRRTAAEERRLARAELQSAQMDALTGAYMRDLGYLTLENEIVRTRRSEQEFVVAFVDVDGLKKFNDERGHAAGDDLLKTIVAIIRDQLRAYDPVVRVGGDEFLCGLVATDLVTARKRANDIGHAVGDAAASSVTIGLAELKPGDSLDELISRADADMYGHKAA